MIYEITKDTIVDESYGVLYGGTYSEYELVTCYILSQPDEPYCKFEARYVLFGPETYINGYGVD
jgi:hypothetical protein